MNEKNYPPLPPPVWLTGPAGGKNFSRRHKRRKEKIIPDALKILLVIAIIIWLLDSDNSPFRPVLDLFELNNYEYAKKYYSHVVTFDGKIIPINVNGGVIYGLP